MKPNQERRRLEIATTALLSALAQRSPEIAFHCKRVTQLAVDLGSALGLSGEQIHVVRVSSLLHDIGKLSLADAVLSKAAALNAEEWEQIQRHPVLGATLLRSLDFPEPVCLAVEQHHERLDGQGYPFKLRKKQISVAARVLSVADTYDAITRTRSYRQGATSVIALDEISSYSGTQFDSDVVNAFLKLHGPKAEKLAA